MALTDKLTAIANAIRAKSGKTDALSLDGMVTEINALSVGGGSDDTAQKILDRTIASYSDNSITTIGNYAFYACTSLTNVTLPACTSIGNNAFYSCAKLTTVSASACTYIGTSAF